MSEEDCGAGRMMGMIRHSLFYVVGVFALLFIAGAIIKLLVGQEFSNDNWVIFIFLGLLLSCPIPLLPVLPLYSIMRIGYAYFVAKSPMGLVNKIVAGLLASLFPVQLYSFILSFDDIEKLVYADFYDLHECASYIYKMQTKDNFIDIVIAGGICEPKVFSWLWSYASNTVFFSNYLVNYTIDDTGFFSLIWGSALLIIFFTLKTRGLKHVS